VAATWWMWAEGKKKGNEPHFFRVEGNEEGLPGGKKKKEQGRGWVPLRGRERKNSISLLKLGRKSAQIERGGKGKPSLNLIKEKRKFPKGFGGKEREKRGGEGFFLLVVGGGAGRPRKEDARPKKEGKKKGKVHLMTRGTTVWGKKPSSIRTKGKKKLESGGKNAGCPMSQNLGKREKKKKRESSPSPREKKKRKRKKEKRKKKKTRR